MELVEAAKEMNDFGLRKIFPWSGHTNSAPWTQDVSNDSEKDYIRKLLKLPGECNIKVKRVENPYLWARYVLRHEELKYISIREEIVIHATSLEKANIIADENFDWRRVKKCRYGKGVSFTNDRQHADRYAAMNTCYIIAGINQGRSIIGTYDTIIPPEGYDTTENYYDSVFVKYYDDDFYPYYIVEK